MVREGVPVHKILEVLERRYRENVTSVRKIAHLVGISRPTVAKYLDLARGLGIEHWPLREDSGDMDRLREALYPKPEETVAASGAVLPDWTDVEGELRRRKKTGVTRRILWEEYRQAHPEGLGYSQFCRLYQERQHQKDLRLVHPHAPGEELYVDYSGDTVLIEPPNDTPFTACVFLGVMGRSSYLFAYATRDMKAPSWILAHRMTFEFLGGVPKAVIPDRPKTVVVANCRVEPRFHRAFREMALHYGFEIYPARSGKGSDKGAVENGVLQSQQILMARMRHRKFVSIGELNAALREQGDLLNRSPFQKRPGTRLSVFLEEDRPALSPLPLVPFETEDWRSCTVYIDYHITIEKYFHYSVPMGLVWQMVDVRVGTHTVEIFFREERVASHLRNCDRKAPYRTVRDHMPPNHKGYLDRSQETFLKKAAAIGPGVVLLFQGLFKRWTYAPLAYRSCQGVLSLCKAYPNERINDACFMAVRMKSHSYKTVEGILVHGTDKVLPLDMAGASSSRPHKNVRGKTFYEATPEGPTKTPEDPACS